jgi:hypothetical protein
VRRTAALLVVAVGLPGTAAAGPEQVTIAGRTAEDPAAYEALLGDLDPASPAPPDARSVEIVLRDAEGADRVEYFPLEEVMLRGGDWFHVPGELANRIEEELEERAAEDQAAWPAYVTLFLLLGGAGMLIWFKWGRRRSQAPAT